MAEPARTRTRLARHERREQIIDAATELFSGRDSTAITFEEIADAAGVSRALVYNYFGDRHGLIEAMYCRNVDELDRRVSEILSSTRGLRDALRGAVRAHLEFARDDPAGYRHAAGEIAFPRLAELAGERIARLAAAFGGSRDAFVLARGMLSALHGMVLWWLDEGAHDIDAALDVVSAFLNGAVGALIGSGAPAHGNASVRLTPTWPVPV